MDAKNRPQPGAAVTVRLGDAKASQETLYSNENGLVLFHGLPDGRPLHIRAEMPGAIPAEAESQCVNGGPALTLAVVEPLAVPMAALLANPEQFEQLFVRTEGYLTLGFEHDRLFVSKEDFVNNRWLNSLAVDAPNWMRDRKLNNRHVSITARFRVLDGAGGLYSVRDCYRLDR